MSRQSWPGSSTPGSARPTSQVALRADPVRAWLSGAGCRAVAVYRIRRRMVRASGRPNSSVRPT